MEHTTIKGEQPVTIKVFGASDDLIELRGAVVEEFCGGERPRFLRFSDGTVLRVAYDKPDMGVWSVKLVQQGTATVSIEECFDEDADPYSDVATVTGEITGLTCCDSMTPTARDYADALHEVDWEYVSLDKLKAIFEML